MTIVIFHANCAAVSPSSSKAEGSSPSLGILALIFLIGGLLLLMICLVILAFTFWKHIKQLVMKKTVGLVMKKTLEQELENAVPGNPH